MIEIQQANLENVVYFKTANAVLNANALTFVRGSNQDADPATPTGNGSGKSLLFSAIPTVAYATPPTSTRKKAKKEILGKTSKNGLTVKASNGHVYQIIQTSTKYTILQDGVDQKIRTTPLAEAFIKANIFPLPEIEYYSHCYLSSLRPFPMQMDTDSNRLEHLSTIFKLDSYAQLRSHFATKLRDIKDNEVRLSVLEQKYVTLQTKINGVKRNLSSSSLKESKTEFLILEAKVNTKVRQEFEILKTKQSLETLLTIETELDALRSRYTYEDHPKARRAWLKQQKSIAKQHEEYKSLLKAYTRSVKTTQEQLDALELPSLSTVSLKKKEKIKAEQLERVEEELNMQQATKLKANAIWAKAAPLVTELKNEHGISGKQKVDLKEDYNTHIESCRTSLRLKVLLEQHDHDKTEANTCPTCLSTVDLDNIKSVVTKAKKDLPLYEKKKRAQELYEKLSTYREQFAACNYDSDLDASLQEKFNALDSSLDKIREDLVICEKHADLSNTLSNIEKPVKPDLEPETSMTYDELDEHIELCNSILSHINSKNKLLENSPSIAEFKTSKAVKLKIETAQTAAETLEKELNTIRSRMGELSFSIGKQATLKSEYELYLSELNDTKKEIDELKPSLGDKKILDVLLKAYSSKGLKTVVANRICTLLESNLNFYRNLIFAEPFVFSVLASETGLSIRVDRGNDKESDVRNLSGAESDCFSLLFLMALLPLIPDSNRLNMVVLDEPTSHCDPETRRLFLEVYLPALMEVVPNIYVITNEPEEYIEGSREWLVVKKRGVSKLVTL